MTVISFCMIVRKVLKVPDRCLKPVSDLVDEMMIADTGSIHRNPEIVASYKKYAAPVSRK